MITGIRLLQSIGQFDHVPAGAIVLDRNVLVFAENGRGKTTLANVFRSLATGDPIPIRERRRLASANPPRVALICSTLPRPAVFEDGAWNQKIPGILIFDDTFVDENIHSGLTVEPTHRQRLHELVIGARGVALSRELQQLVARIEEHNAALRERAARITPAIRDRLEVDDFCDLPPIPDIDTEIQAAERDLAATRQTDSIRATPALDPIAVGSIRTEEAAETLARGLPQLEATAVARVQKHIAALGRGGEAWVADGIQRIQRDSSARELCPFCAQDLTPSNLIGHYRAYFGEEYASLNRDIARCIAEINTLHPPDFPARLERAVRTANDRRRFWADFCDIPEIAVDTDALIREWQVARDGIVRALVNKRGAPLDPQQIPSEVLASSERLNALRETTATLNRQIARANEDIRAVKARAAEADIRAVEARLARLRATRARYSEEAATLCNEYLREKVAKAETERRRDETRENLERYRQEAFPLYEEAINNYLACFGTGFRVRRITPADTRGGATCNYDVLINNVPIQISGAVAPPGEPSFRSTLSSGDRTSLALAFFFSSLGRDPELGSKIVVIDDPLSSLDDQRAMATAQEIRRIGQRTEQLIVLSHDRRFLCRIWENIDHTRTSAIKIERDGNGSNINEWDVSRDSLTEHDRNHQVLRSYIEDGPRGNERQVAVALRPVLEAFLRVAYPANCRPARLAIMSFKNECTQKLGTPAEILTARDIGELNDILEYANRFHHDTNIAADEAIINDGELRGFVQRVLLYDASRNLVTSPAAMSSDLYYNCTSDQ
jgi:wobble nucleotide-excising tRNase